jgi:hypothetical protein
VSKVCPVRRTTFWQRMHARFGAAYADSLARDLVIASLGGRTVLGALEAGIEPAEVWAAVCEAMDVPVRERH